MNRNMDTHHRGSAETPRWYIKAPEAIGNRKERRRLAKHLRSLMRAGKLKVSEAR